MFHGFCGKILHVNLTTQSISIESPEASFYRDYVGGSLMGLYYLWKNTPQGTDALSPENTLTFAVGPATGLPVSGQSRCTVTCKSPSSGGVADSQAGGFWPAELKYAGFDAVVVHGRAASPVYLWVKDGQAELRDASHLWGKLTYEVDTALKAELGDDKIEIAQIGPAGEKLANFAAIINMSNRAWGRTGVGAVMGSKNLKAVVVRGSEQIQAADKARVSALAKQGAQDLKPTGMDGFGRYGTPGGVMGQQGSGGLPTRNWNQGVFDDRADAERISGERLYDEILRGAAEDAQDRKGRDTCYACVVRCKRVVESEWQNNPLLPEYGGPEYETVATFGSYCGISDLHAVTYANQLCNAYGVDTVSCGASIAWAIECAENGVLTADETDGIALRYGDAEAMIAMLEKTLKREGFGDVLAEGSQKAADKLGKGHEYLITIKGQEMPAHMPQVKRSMALIYATNPFGADHQSSEHDPAYTPRAYEKVDRYRERFNSIGLSQPQESHILNAEKVDFALKTQYTVSAMDSYSLCQFVYGASWQLSSPQDAAELVSASSGMATDLARLQFIGQKRLNLMRAFNAREGLSREQDYLPQKLFDKALKGGKTDGVKLEQAELEQAMDIYFDKAGWDVTTGVPTRTTLETLDLGWVADDLGLS